MEYKPSNRIKNSEKKMYEDESYYLQKDINPDTVDVAIMSFRDKYTYGYSLLLQTLFSQIAETDMKVTAAIDNRKASINGLEYTLNPLDNTPQAIKDYIKTFVENFDLTGFNNLCIDARLRQFSIATIDSTIVKDGYIYPSNSITTWDSKFFERNPKNNRYYIYKLYNNQYNPSDEVNGDNAIIIEEDKNGTPVLTPLLKNEVAKYWMMSNWINKNQLYGKPGIFYVLNGMYDENSAEYKTAVNALENYQDYNMAVINASSTEDSKFPIKIIPTDTRPTESFEKIIRYFDDCNAQLILGTGAGTEQERYGTRATSTAKLATVWENRVKDDMKFISTQMNKVINKWVKLNFNTDYEVPNNYFTLSMPKNSHDLIALIQGMFDATGVTVDKKYLADTLGFDIDRLVDTGTQDEDTSVESVEDNDVNITNSKFKQNKYRWSNLGSEKKKIDLNRDIAFNYIDSNKDTFLKENIEQGILDSVDEFGYHEVKMLENVYKNTYDDLWLWLAMFYFVGKYSNELSTIQAKSILNSEDIVELKSKLNDIAIDVEVDINTIINKLSILASTNIQLFTDTISKRINKIKGDIVDVEEVKSIILENIDYLNNSNIISQENAVRVLNIGLNNTILSMAEQYPYARYRAIEDDVTTEFCLSYNGSVVEVGSSIFNRISPPNHFNCRSHWELLDNYDGDVLEKSIVKDGSEIIPENGFANPILSIDDLIQELNNG
jgi:phage gp29-like protein